MAYATYEDHVCLYGTGGPDRTAFDRLAWEAGRVMDQITTGVDGVHKLSEAPPEDACGAEALRRCQCALVQKLWELEQNQSYVNRGDGTVMGRVVTAVTAGAESVSFAAPGQVSGGTDRTGLLRQTAEEYLSGVADANGVALLYAGRYPLPPDKRGRRGV